MYEDIMEDPEVTAIIDKYDNSNANDVPLDEFGKPLEIEENKEDGKSEDVHKDDTKVEDESAKGDDNKDEVTIDPTQFEEYQEEVPEIDYTPKTEFAKSLDFDKIPDDFSKYVLANVEPIELKDAEGKTFRAYTVDDIPNDFKFASEQEAMKVSTELSRLATKGEQLKQEYDNQLKAKEDALAVNESVAAQLDGLSDAISNGEFPKLELDSKGNLDEGSKINTLANDVIKYQNEQNKGKSPSRAISFDTALRRFERQNPDRFKDLDDSLSKEDKQREGYAKRTSSTSQRSSKQPKVGKYDNLTREEFDQLLNDPNFDVSELMK